ncbi:MAG: hypothetical protein DI602_04400 [Aliarcobacter butzleri]|nr:MAG: hypothetical protein DI602_04400 [Aliarcobacter butzleri]
MSLFSNVSPNNSKGVLIIELSLSYSFFIFEMYAISSSFGKFKFILNLIVLSNSLCIDNLGLLSLKKFLSSIIVV